MKLLGIDLETTGLDTENDHITEIGYVLIDTEIKKPLICRSHLIRLDGVVVPDLITEITSITTDMLVGYGETPSKVLIDLDLRMNEADYIVAHNGNAFDKPFLYRWAKSFSIKLPDKPWLDTYEDVPYPKHYRYRNLTYLAAEHGFINPFPHAALFDTMAMMKILSHYEIKDVIARHKTPWVVLRAMVDYDRREDAKKQGYQWQNVGNKTYTKCWVKRVKQDEVEEEIDKVSFQVKIIQENN